MPAIVVSAERVQRTPRWREQGERMSDDPVLALLTRLADGQIRIENGLKQVDTRLAQLEAGQTQIEAGYKQFDTRLTHIETQLTQLDRRLTQVETGHRQLEAGLARLEAAQTSLRVDLMARLDRVQDSVTAVRDDVGVNLAQSERAHEAIADTRAEVRSLGQQVAVAFRRIRQLEERVREITGDP